MGGDGPDLDDEFAVTHSTRDGRTRSNRKDDDGRTSGDRRRIDQRPSQIEATQEWRDRRDENKTSDGLDYIGHRSNRDDDGKTSGDQR